MTPPRAPPRPSPPRPGAASGVPLLVGGATIISFSSVFVALAGAGPGATAFYRMLFGGSGLLLFLGGWRSLRGPDLRGGWGRATAAASIIGIELVMWHRSIELVGPGTGTLLANLQVFVLAGYGVLRLGERVTVRLAVAVLSALAGLWLISTADTTVATPTEQRLGVILGVLSALAYGVYVILLRGLLAGRTPRAQAGQLMRISFLTLPVVVAASAGRGESLAIPDARTGLLLVAYGILSQAVGWHVISRGLPRVPPSRAGLILLLQPSLAIVWDVLLLARPLSAAETAGAALSLTGIFLGLRRSVR